MSMRQKCVKIKSKNPENTEISMFSGFIPLYFVIPTRKMKLNSKRFCLGDLIPFDFS